MENLLRAKVVMSYIEAVSDTANYVHIVATVVGSMSSTSEKHDPTPQRKAWSLPAWLDGRTIALFTAVVTATLTLGTMMQTAHSQLANDIHQVRRELSADIEKVRDELSADIEKVRDELSDDVTKLDDRLRSVEIDVTAIRTAMVGFDARVRTVEEHASHPIVPAPAG